MTLADDAPASRRRTSALEGRQEDPVFLSQSGATILLDHDLTIRAATPAYTEVTHRRVDELLSVNVFDAFPDNPEAEVQSTRRLAEAIEQAVRTRRTQHLLPMRYDIPDPRRRGRFVEKRWAIACTPVRDGDEVIGTAVQGRDLALVEDDLVQVLSQYRDALAHGDLRAAATRDRLDGLGDYLHLVEEHGRLAAEVAGLREALTTRPTIDQAKGIIMADRRCGPEDAWEVLKQLSMDTNVRVADVAAALVYQAQRR